MIINILSTDNLLFQRHCRNRLKTNHMISDIHLKLTDCEFLVASESADDDESITVLLSESM